MFNKLKLLKKTIALAMNKIPVIYATLKVRWILCLHNIKFSRYIKNKIDLIIVEIMQKISNIIEKIKIMIPVKFMYFYVISLWVILGLFGYITESRFIRFCIVLIIISIYKILYKNIHKLDNYIKLEQGILLKIYKYKNPVVLLIIEIELKLFYIMYNLKKKEIKQKYINIIYHVLYHITGYNGLKIILYKFYRMIYWWNQYSIYELLFKRIFGMILSVLIFSDIIKVILNILNTISTNYIMWIYIFLIIISYIFNVHNINEIGYHRISINLIWNIINIKIHQQKINQDIKNFLGLCYINDIFIFNYNNFMIYLICQLDTKKWIKYNNIIMVFDYCSRIKKHFNTNYIYVKNYEKKKFLNNSIIDYCEYQILLCKLRIYYLWDLENKLELKDSLLKIEAIQNLNEISINDLDNIDLSFDSSIFFSYEYTVSELKNIYYDKIKNKKLDNFWNLIENQKFYDKYINYLNDYMFQDMFRGIQVSNSLELESYINNYPDINYGLINFGLTLQEIKEQVNWLKQELNNWRRDWDLSNQQKVELESKYFIIFGKIDDIKNKYKKI